MYIFKSHNVFTACAFRVLRVRNVVGQINRVDLAGDPEMRHALMKDTGRFADMGPPFEDLGRPKPAYCRRHEHQLVQRKRMNTDNRNKLLENELRKLPVIDFGLSAPAVARRIVVTGWQHRTETPGKPAYKLQIRTSLTQLSNTFS